MWRSAVLLPLLLGAASALTKEQFLCPEDEGTGKFGDPDECNKYWECFRGVHEEKYCDDGLGFDPQRYTSGQTNPCDYLYKLDCEAAGLVVITPPRTDIEAGCLRANGIYPHVDPNICDEYYTCTDGKATLALCPPGLHFNNQSKLCDWPAAAKRGTCTKLRSLPDGFTCNPSKSYYTASKQKMVHPKFPNTNDCTKFYVCQNGIEPAISGCDPGLVFNERTSDCDVVENVPECDPDYNYEDYAPDVSASDAVNV